MTKKVKSYCQLNISADENQTVAYKLQTPSSSRCMCGGEYYDVPVGCRNITEWVVDWINSSPTIGYCSECFQKNEENPLEGLRTEFSTGLYLPGNGGERCLVVPKDNPIAEYVLPRGDDCDRCGSSGHLYLVSIDRLVSGETLCHRCLADEHPNKQRNVGYLLDDEADFSPEVLLE